MGGIVRLEKLMDNWMSGMPIAGSDLTQRLLDYNTAWKAFLAALEEIAVLWDANPGTLVTTPDGAGMPMPKRIL